MSLLGLWYTCVYAPAASVPLEGLPDEALAVHDTLDAAMRVVPGPEKVVEAACTDTLNFSLVVNPTAVDQVICVELGDPAVLAPTSATLKLTPAGTLTLRVCSCAHAGRAAETSRSTRTPRPSLRATVIAAGSSA